MVDKGVLLLEGEQHCVLQSCSREPNGVKWSLPLIRRVRRPQGCLCNLPLSLVAGLSPPHLSPGDGWGLKDSSSEPAPGQPFPTPKTSWFYRWLGQPCYLSHTLGLSNPTLTLLTPYTPTCVFSPAGSPVAHRPPALGRPCSVPG